MLSFALALQAGARGGTIGLVVNMVLFGAIFYFLFILPQRREAKRHREMLAALRPGQEVVTTGGVVGEVIQIKDDLVTLKSGDARLVVEKLRITRLRTDPAPATR